MNGRQGDVDPLSEIALQDSLIRMSYEATLQSLERRACAEHSLAMLQNALDRSARNLRTSMNLLIRGV